VREKGIVINGLEWTYVTGGQGERAMLLFHGEFSKRLIAAETPEIAERVRSFKTRLIDHLDHQMTREILMSRMNLLFSLITAHGWKLGLRLAQRLDGGVTVFFLRRTKEPIQPGAI
jgi:hypothetical protein